jgi:hypothetical protein
MGEHEQRMKRGSLVERRERFAEPQPAVASVAPSGLKATEETLLADSIFLMRKPSTTRQ